MVADWVQGFEVVDLGVSGQDYDGDDPWKIELHMTQGDSIEGAESAFRKYPPHLAMEYEGFRKRQYVSLNKAAYSNLSGATDRSHTIQIEIVGHSENAPNFWGVELDWIGTDGLAAIKRAGVDFAMTMAPQAFHGGDEGIKPYLATASSPIRFNSQEEMRAFSGVLGHQHEPPPDDHWDPGRLDVARILTAAAWSLGQNPTIPLPVPVGPPISPPVMPVPTWYSRLLFYRKPQLIPWGFDIHRAQTLLIAHGHGYATRPDGWFGANTDYSVRSFQRERGLKVDGVIGQNTARALGQ